MAKKLDEHIHFQTIREEFNEYEVENGQILKIKKVLVDIIEEKDDQGNTRSGLKIQDLAHVMNTKLIDTTSMEKVELKTISDKDEVEELNFVPKKEFVNIYETEKSILLISLRITKILSTNKIDNTGCPYIRYRSEFALNVLSKQSLWEPPSVEKKQKP